MYNKPKLTNKKKWIIRSQKDRWKQQCMLSEREQCEVYILHVSNYITFWKRQIYTYEFFKKVSNSSRKERGQERTNYLGHLNYSVW